MCTICSQLGLTSSFSQAIAAARSPSPGASGVGDSLYPGFGNGGYDTQRYVLDLNVTDVETSTLTGIATIDAIATQDLSSFNFDLIGFTIDNITVKGQPATFSRDGQELTITPGQFIADGEEFSVVVEYSGAPTPLNSVAFTFPVPTGWVLSGGGQLCFE
jgi:hypothetical protein